MVDGAKRAERRRKYYDSVVSIWFEYIWTHFYFSAAILNNLCKYMVRKVTFMSMLELLTRLNLQTYCKQ
jgi:hypothetical protein